MHYHIIFNNTRQFYIDIIKLGYNHEVLLDSIFMFYKTVNGNSYSVFILKRDYYHISFYINEEVKFNKNKISIDNIEMQLRKLLSLLRKVEKDLKNEL